MYRPYGVCYSGNSIGKVAFHHSIFSKVFPVAILGLKSVGGHCGAKKKVGGPT